MELILQILLFIPQKYINYLNIRRPSRIIISFYILRYINFDYLLTIYYN